MYPFSKWLHVDIDGYQTNKTGSAGAKISSEFYSHYVSLGKFSTHFDGELMAINITLQQLILHVLQCQKIKTNI